MLLHHGPLLGRERGGKLGACGEQVGHDDLEWWCRGGRPVRRRMRRLGVETAAVCVAREGCGVGGDGGGEGGRDKVVVATAKPKDGHAPAYLRLGLS